jgi:hypothetical protein
VYVVNIINLLQAEFLQAVPSDLILSGSAVAVECIFSGGRDMISLRRARLKPEIIWILIVVKQRFCLARDAAETTLGDLW